MNMLPNMKKAITLTAILTGVTAPAAQAMVMTDSWLNFREAYLTGSQQFQTKMEYGAKFDDVWYISISNTAGNGDRLNHFTSRYNEMETNYKIPLSSRLSFYPGGVFNWSSTGSAADPYVKLGYNLLDNLTLLGGYRYNHNNYLSTTIDEDKAHDANHEFNVWLDWSITDRIWTEYDFTYHKRIGDFRYGNGSTENYEHTIALAYKVDNHLTPYIDCSWLDKATNGNKEGRVRVGVFYHF